MRSNDVDSWVPCDVCRKHRPARSLLPDWSKGLAEKYGGIWTLDPGNHMEILNLFRFSADTGILLVQGPLSRTQC